MTVEHLIAAVAACHGTIQVDGEDLLLETYDCLPEALLSALRARKAEIIARIARPSDEYSSVSGERDPTAAPDRGIPSEWAEGYALLLSMPRPSSIPRERWDEALQDASNLLDEFGALAAALGWRKLEVFGVHPSRPHAAISMAGLIWLIQGGHINEITSTSARIRMRSGVIQTYYRTETLGAVPLWLVESEVNIK